MFLCMCLVSFHSTILIICQRGGKSESHSIQGFSLFILIACQKIQHYHALWNNKLQWPAQSRHLAVILWVSDLQHQSEFSWWSFFDKIHSPLKDQLELSANRDSWDLCMCTAVLCNGKETMRTSFFFNPINYWESVTSNVPAGRGHDFPGEEFDSVVHLFTLGNILMGWGHIHPWVIVHCVPCWAIMDSLSTHWPCLLLQHALNNRPFAASAWKILPSKGLERFNKAGSSNIIKQNKGVECEHTSRF